MSETNIKQNNPQYTKHNNAVYYNHLLHFKQSGSNDQFPFLQGLMSNDLFPIWLKSNEGFHFEANQQEAQTDQVLVEDLLIKDDADLINTPQDQDAITSSETETASQVDENITSDENVALINEDILNQEQSQFNENFPEKEVDLPSIEENTNVKLLGQLTDEVTIEGLSQIIAEETIGDVPEMVELAPRLEESTENERFTLTELMQGVEEVSQLPNKKRKLKQSQKKILKKNILFFKELPELNSFNKWLIQQKPMEEGNLVKLLKLSKKAKKHEKKRKLNEGIEASIQKNDKLVSEVLAKILASQGHYVEAIEMYKQLILNIPEKSNTFAAEIDELNKKII